MKETRESSHEGKKRQEREHFFPLDYASLSQLLLGINYTWFFRQRCPRRAICDSSGEITWRRRHQQRRSLLCLHRQPDSCSHPTLLLLPHLFFPFFFLLLVLFQRRIKHRHRRSCNGKNESQGKREREDERRSPRRWTGKRRRLHLLLCF